MKNLLFYLPYLGQFLIGFFFLFFGISNIINREQIAAFLQEKIPYSVYILWIAIIWEIICALMIILGVYVKIAALLLIPFVIIATLTIHSFWNFRGQVRQLNKILFISNFTMTLGALFLLMNNVLPNANLYKFFH